MARRGYPRQATYSSPYKEKLRGPFHLASLCIRYCKLQSSMLEYTCLLFKARLKWMVAWDRWTFTLPVLYTTNGVSIPLPSPLLFWNHSSWVRYVWSGRGGDEPCPNTSPLNQRFSQLIYLALEKVMVLLFESVPGTYKIYSNAINIIL